MIPMDEIPSPKFPSEGWNPWAVFSVLYEVGPLQQGDLFAVLPIPSRVMALPVGCAGTVWM